MTDPRSTISAALHEHQGWQHAPADECDCCADAVLDALCLKGERVVLDRTGGIDQMFDIEPVLNLGTEDDHLAADDGTIVYQGPGVLYEIYEQENDR